MVRRARRRARQRRRRAQAVTGGVAALALLLAVPAVDGLLGTGSPPSGPEAVGTAPLAPPPFPFVPTVSLSGYGEPVAEVSAGVPVLRYSGGQDRWLTVSVTAGRPSPSASSGAMYSSSLLVRGHPASLELGPTDHVLSWQESADRWVRLHSDPHLTVRMLTAYAAGLVPGVMPVRPPFTFDVVPAGLMLESMARDRVFFCRPDGPPGPSAAGRLVVMLVETALAPLVDQASGLPDGKPVRVGGRPGRLDVTPRSTVVLVDLGDDRTLRVESSSSLDLDAADLLSFAAGTRPTERARVVGGEFDDVTGDRVVEQADSTGGTGPASTCGVSPVR
ncbi:hypothetical protein O7626_09540 [Micromonospora sp. WMMD1102]|uniref:hypothetical protein n=1 Tax=Micromonospora sp. WMMD1102 TaxID=3016105 RepID=UPI0024155DFD|nr:hypothetical protein [Micromonospora sp. WMMD1102]MDG4786167.1 hypothetical protein [Micromonospora sp. WMMD1102]